MNDDLDEEDARPEEGEWATDDLSGEFIETSDVRAARKEETEFMIEIELLEDSAAEDCCSSTGKPPVSTKWTDSNEGEGVRWPVIARRKATSDKDRADLFASTPSRRC